MQSNLFGNPHSASPSSHLSSIRIDEARRAVLEYFSADANHFDVIFTANASAAIKLVREAFVNSEHGYVCGYHRDCHTSIVGLRESAHQVKYFVSDEAVESWIDDACSLDPTDTSDCLQLFAYPAQSNLSGHRCSLEWPSKIKRRVRGKVFTLLDAASYLTTSRLSLADPRFAPDFVCLSFYKIFGFPNLGALLVNKTTGAADILVQHRTGAISRTPLQSTRGVYFGGGTVDMIINSTDRSEDWFAMKAGSSRLNSQHHVPAGSIPTPKDLLSTSNNVHELLEDGTLPFHSILALNHAIPIHTRLFGPPERIRQHTAWLVKELFNALSSLRHASGNPIVQVYTSPAESTFSKPNTQGPILAFTLLTPTSTPIGKSTVEAAAIACNFQLRTGGVCNPGGIASHLDLEPWEMRRNFAEGMRCGDEMDVVMGKATGVVRASLGVMSCERDVRRFSSWVRWWFGDSKRGVESGLGAGDVRVQGQVQEQRGEDQEAKVRELEVIEGLAPAKVTWRQSGTEAESTRIDKQKQRSSHTAEALQCWKNDWVLIALDSMFLEPVDSEALIQARNKIDSEIRPEDGVIVISHKGEGKQNHDSQTNNNASDPKYEDTRTATNSTSISLYDVPTPAMEGHLSTSQVLVNRNLKPSIDCGHDLSRSHTGDGQRGSGSARDHDESEGNTSGSSTDDSTRSRALAGPRKAHLYHKASIEAFFTSALGIRCTLARYAADTHRTGTATRSRASDTTGVGGTRTDDIAGCSKSDCQWKGSADALNAHYQCHALEFKMWFENQEREQRGKVSANPAEENMVEEATGAQSWDPEKGNESAHEDQKEGDRGSEIETGKEGEECEYSIDDGNGHQQQQRQRQQYHELMSTTAKASDGRLHDRDQGQLQPHTVAVAKAQPQPQRPPAWSSLKHHLTPISILTSQPDSRTKRKPKTKVETSSETEIKIKKHTKPKARTKVKLMLTKTKSRFNPDSRKTGFSS